MTLYFCRLFPGPRPRCLLHKLQEADLLLVQQQRSLQPGTDRQTVGRVVSSELTAPSGPAPPSCRPAPADPATRRSAGLVLTQLTLWTIIKSMNNTEHFSVPNPMMGEILLWVKKK